MIRSNHNYEDDFSLDDMPGDDKPNARPSWPGRGKGVRYRPDSGSVDWNAVKQEFRSGQLSVSQICNRYGIQRALLLERALRGHWLHDLREEVQERIAENLLTEDSDEVDEAVETAAKRGADVVRQHREDIRRWRAITNQVADRLEGYLNGDSEDSRIFRSKGDGVATLMQAGSNSLKYLIPLERQAYNIDNERSGRETDMAKSLEQAQQRLKELKEKHNIPSPDDPEFKPDADDMLDASDESHLTQAQQRLKELKEKHNIPSPDDPETNPDADDMLDAPGESPLTH